MRAGIVVNVTRADRHRLEAIVSDRSAHSGRIAELNRIRSPSPGRPAVPYLRPRPPPVRCRSRSFGPGRNHAARHGRAPSASFKSSTVARNVSTSISTACARSCRAPARRILVSGFVDLVGLTKGNNIASLVHGVSLSLRGSGRLDTRLDTPPISGRHHPLSRIAPFEAP
jgi:hypothetical protein